MCFVVSQGMNEKQRKSEKRVQNREDNLYLNTFQEKRKRRRRKDTDEAW